MELTSLALTRTMPENFAMASAEKGWCHHRCGRITVNLELLRD